MKTSLQATDKVKITLAPRTDENKATEFTEIPKWSVVEGSAKLDVSEDGKTCTVTASEKVETVKVEISGKLNRGLKGELAKEKNNDVSGVINIEVVSQTEGNLGITVGVSEPAAESADAKAHREALKHQHAAKAKETGGKHTAAIIALLAFVLSFALPSYAGLGDPNLVQVNSTLATTNIVLYASYPNAKYPSSIAAGVTHTNLLEIDLSGKSRVQLQFTGQLDAGDTTNAVIVFKRNVDGNGGTNVYGGNGNLETLLTWNASVATTKTTSILNLPLGTTGSTNCPRFLYVYTIGLGAATVGNLTNYSLSAYATQ